MFEYDFGIPKNHPDYAKVVQQLQKITTVENGSDTASFTVDRIPAEYLNSLRGVELTFTYARLLNQQRPGYFVDIGCGSGKAIGALAKEPYATGLTFKGTGLVHNTFLNRNLGFNNFVNTPVETMDGFEDNSVVGTTAVFSIAYSASPAMAIESLDRVFVPGAIFKGVFDGTNPIKSPIKQRLGLQEPELFESELKDRGYDTVILPGNEESVLLAIKPGLDSPFSANSILLIDYLLYKLPDKEKYQSEIEKMLSFINQH